jgi:uridylate kinase
LNKRVLIKLSGEALEGEDRCVDNNALEKIALQLKELLHAGFQVGVVLGGGNFFRGLQGQKSLTLRRVQADHVGMIATLMNGLILADVLHRHDVPHKVLTALPCEGIESYSYSTMNKALETGEALLFVGGTGHPYFTTDTAAALRASEMGAALLLKATTQVDGIYNKDPRKESDAIKYTILSYKQALDEKLQVLDLTAFTLCMENKIDIRVYKYDECSFLQVLQESNYGSLVTGDK